MDRKVFFEGIVNGSPDPITLLREDRAGEVLTLIAAARERTEHELATAAPQPG